MIVVYYFQWSWLLIVTTFYIFDIPLLLSVNINVAGYLIIPN